MARFPTDHDAGRRMAGVRAAPQEARPSFGEEFHHLALALHRQSRVVDAAMVAVNEGKQLLGCDRVALFAWRGKQAKLLAVSGQERIATRANLVRSAEQLAAALMPAGKPFLFVGDLDMLPPQLAAPLVDYMRESGARRIEALPLRLPTPQSAETARDRQDFETTGLLLLENFEDAAVGVDSFAAAAIADHAAVALANAAQCQRAASPMRRLLRSFYAADEQRTARRAAMTLGLMLLGLVAAGFVPVRHRVEASGKLLPVRRAEVFAPDQGRVDEVLVETNQRVAKGDVLVRLTNERLSGELLSTRHRLEEKQKLLATLEAQVGEAADRDGAKESIRLSGTISQTRIEIESLESRVTMLERETAELDVRAPLGGVVTTFDPRRTLLNRPVERGETLVEVMDTSGPWELELALPAKRIGHVLRAQQTSGGEATPVYFLLTTHPETVHTGALRVASARAVADSHAASIVPLVASVPAGEIAEPVPGTDVTARIDCGRRPLAGALFGDVADFCRTLVW